MLSFLHGPSLFQTIENWKFLTIIIILPLITAADNMKSSQFDQMTDGEQLIGNDIHTETATLWVECVSRYQLQKS